MNRRRHPRLDSDIPAVIEYQDQTYDACRMLNFSNGGAYLQCADDSLKDCLPDGYFAEYERPLALLSLPTESLQAQVQVVYFHEGALGVAFHDAAGTQLFETLYGQHQAQRERQRKVSQVSPIDLAHTHKLLDQLQLQARDFLQNALPTFFSKTLQELQLLIDETSDPQEKSVLFYAFNSLQQDQDELIEGFLGRNAQGFATMLGDPQEMEAQEVEEPAELALVEKQEIDIWILLNDVARRVESEVSRSLFQFEVALSYLCQGNIHNELNPLAPISLLSQLKSVLDDFEFDVRITRVMLGAFRSTLLSDLGFLYAKLLQLLRQQGIGDEEQELQGQWTIVKTPEQSPQGDRPIGHLATLANRHPSSGAGDALARMSATEREEVLASLASLSSLQGVTLQQQIEQLLTQENAQPVKLSPEARSAIGAGEELVSVLSKDPLVTAELRALLGSLKFLIIEAVLQDTNLLDNPEHPVQRLLDSIESLKPYVNTGSHASLMRDRVSHRLASITEGVESGRIEHVDQITQEIGVLLREQHERFEKNRKLAISRCLKDEKLRRAQTMTREVLSQRLLHNSVSIAVDKLLRFGWVNLLVQTAVVEGEQSKGWQAYLQVLDQLIKLFAAEAAWRPLTAKWQQSLLSTVHKGFNDYPVHPEAARQFEGALRQALAGGELAVSGFIEQRVEVDEAYLEQFFQGMQIAHEPASQASPDTAWKHTIEELALDTWLVEQIDQGSLRVLSLAWKNPLSQRYLLVNGDGFTVLDEDLTQLAARFAEGQITPMELSTKPIVERTIETILSNSYDGFRQESTLDPLTGLPNRRAFETELRQRLTEVSKSGEPHILLLIDLDKFQVANDLCGFEGGDRLLQTVTDILLSYLSDEGYLARIGDDEFSLLLRGHDLEQGYQTAESLRLAIDEYPFDWQGRMIPSSASIGIVELESSEQLPGELMKAALAACNLAKQGGGNCTRIFRAGDSAYRDHQQLVQSLPAIKEALSKGQMELYVQPIVPLQAAANSSLHHEILLRIRNTAGELESPQEFIRAAERYDMMRDVDRWVVEAFLALLEPYADRLPQSQSFSINLSGKSIGDAEFRRFLKERINATPLPNRHLGFEITETALVGDIGDTAVFIREIRELGCAFSLDDFGSGYASFSYLKDFPVDFVKIDGMFVREILKKPADYAMINTITEIAHFMDKQVVAEYVVDAEIGRALHDMGVDYGQGDNFGEPRALKLVLQEIMGPIMEAAEVAADVGHNQA